MSRRSYNALNIQVQDMRLPNAYQDYEGNWYDAVVLGDQVWLAENLHTKYTPDGKSITLDSARADSSEPHYFLDGSVTDYGYYYNKAAFTNGEVVTKDHPVIEGIAMTGWHIPSQSEYLQMYNYVDSVTNGEAAKNISSPYDWTASSTTGAPGRQQYFNNGTEFNLTPAGAYLKGSGVPPYAQYRAESAFLALASGDGIGTNYNTTTYTTVSGSGYSIPVRLICDKDAKSFLKWYYRTYGSLDHDIFNEEYLTFRALENGVQIGLKATDASVARTLNYSVNGAAFSQFTSDTTDRYFCTLNKGDEVRVYAEWPVSYVNGTSNYNSFISTGGKWEACGNVHALIGWNLGFGGSCFYALFKDCYDLVNPPEFSKNANLSGTGSHCSNMFANCTSLKRSPQIPFPSALNSCCFSMFSNCSSLSYAGDILTTSTTSNNCFMYAFQNCTNLLATPDLKLQNISTWACANMFQGTSSLEYAYDITATTLANNACQSMFLNSGLSISPAISATSLGENCLQNMFEGCASLTSVTVLPATTLVPGAYNNMFKNCTSLTEVPENMLPSTTLATSCYSGMFFGCTSLIKAPLLPAKNLAISCYSGMFRNCSSLNLIKCYATNVSDPTSYTLYWVNGVSATGTFVKWNEGAEWTVGVSGIPTGWVDSTAEWFYVEDVSGSNNTLTITKSSASGTPSLTIETSSDGNTWTTLGTTALGTPLTATVSANSKLYLRSTSNGTSDESGGGVSQAAYNFITCAADYNAGGNIMSLVHGQNFTGEETLGTSLNNYAFARLFSYSTTLISTSLLSLPIRTLPDYCYDTMFLGCQNMTEGPKKLPATTLSERCYGQMFLNCVLLSMAPELPAQTLAAKSYYAMFLNCSSLSSITCMATDISASQCTESWTRNVAPSGVFGKDPSMQSWTTGTSGIPTGWLTNNGDMFYLEDVSGSDNTFSITKSDANAPTMTVEVSTNQTTWTSLGDTSTTALTATIPANGKLYVRSKGTTMCTSDYYGHYYTNSMTASGNYNVGGNILSLLYGSASTGYETTIPKTNGAIAACTFTRLFQNSNTLKSSANLILPIETGVRSYYFTFTGCVNMTQTVPTMPAFNLSDNCYTSMYYGCTSLTTPPALRSTNIATNCYNGMFSQCTALTSVTQLPATTLYSACYMQMFYSCTHITTAPTLPAQALVANCYNTMFGRCFQLSSVTCHATDISASNCTNAWLDNVAASGTFTTPSSTQWTSGTSGIPTGWTRVDL